MAIKCPKCATVIDAAPDELGLVTCSKCGTRLRSKQPVKVTVQGGSGTSTSSPSLPRINPSMAAPADVDHVLARLDTPSPDATMRPGPSVAGSPPPGWNSGATLETLLAEIRAVQKTQKEILALLQMHPGVPSPSHDDDDVVAAAPSKRGSQPIVLLVDDDLAARQEAAAALPAASVKTAKDGNEALAVIAQEKPSVIVLELEIGGRMSGQDLINMVKATMEWVDIPIVLYCKTPFANESEARHEHGVDAIVAKGPGATGKLAAKVGRLLARG